MIDTTQYMQGYGERALHFLPDAFDLELKCGKIYSIAFKYKADTSVHTLNANFYNKFMGIDCGAANVRLSKTPEWKDMHINIRWQRGDVDPLRISQVFIRLWDGTPKEYAQRKFYIKDIEIREI